jgi:quercetin dioxygenase-like cupin family protein
MRFDRARGRAPAGKDTSMRNPCRTLALVLTAGSLLIASGRSLAAQDPKPSKPAQAAPAAKHALMTPGDIKWGPAPPGLPAGAQAAVLDGDPSKPGGFVLRAKFPDGYRVPPHWHPTAEHVTVISGTFMVGMGDTFNESGMTTLTAGGFAKMPARMRHFVTAKGATEIQIHGTGPFAITYVNAKDDPRKTTTQAR